MSRNFYILAAAFLVFALLSGVMALIPSSFQPGLPANASLWRTLALVLLVCALVSGFVAVMSNLFEQVERRNEAARLAERNKRRSRSE